MSAVPAWVPMLAQGLPSDFDFHTVQSASSARWLIGALPNADRGKAARGLFEQRAVAGDATAFAGMMAAYQHDHGVTVEAFGAFEFGPALARVAPRHALAKPIRVWRGVCLREIDDSADEAWIGFSWTRDRATACWFAFRFAYASAARPLVFRLDVEPSEVIALNHARGEREVILDPYNDLDPYRVTIDGAPGIDAEFIDPDYRAPPDLLARWRRARDRCAARIQEQNRNRLAGRP